MKLGTRIRLSISLGALLLASACGGGGGGGDINVEDLGTEVGNSICADQVKCGFFPDQATCLESIGIQVDQLVADVQAGLINYDSAKARDCLDSLSGSDCSAFGSEPTDDSACDETFEGTIAIGGACITDESCAGLAFCDGSDEEACTQGVCVADQPEPADAKEGQSCAEADCESGLFCNEADVCTTLAGPTEACADFFECVSGYVCALGPDFTPGTCVKMPLSGETCDPELGGPFVGGQLSCLKSTDFCDPSDTKCKSRLSVGSACGEGLENACVNYAECVAASCTAKPGLGDACVVDSEIECLGDLQCESGTCAADPSPEVCTL